ncbi:MAG: SNF2-related protein [Acidobacteriota bacterium]|nr:SNF2-related protein [Acidobacteriota bacterium]
MNEQATTTETNQSSLPEPQTAKDWKEHLWRHIVGDDPDALSQAIPVLGKFPNDPEVLLMTIMAALRDEKPQQALRYLERFLKKFQPLQREDVLLRVIALAQQGLMPLAWQQLHKYDVMEVRMSVEVLPISWSFRSWFFDWVGKIERYESNRQRVEKLKETLAQRQTRKEDRKQAAPKTGTKKKTVAPETETPSVVEPAAIEPEFPPLPRYEIKIPLSLTLPESLEAELTPVNVAHSFDEARQAQTDFRLHYEYTQLGLLQGFDELLCLPMLHDVDTYWYQVEAVRKVLKQFRGRVLLADEVGLGKTIEAGMALKEYLLRGMAERVLILTPATLVGQWQEEMVTKFGIEFATSYDSLARSEPAQFWAQPRVIASIATARRAEHQNILAAQRYDIVIVDEAHHLKNRQTANWKLVDSLNKKFLLMLSATPVQNSLVELYNLLTLLKPGLFKTEKEFRASYMTSGKPRVPANRDRMRDLMREVMIRNTRSLVDVKLPPRHAVTLKLKPLADEGECYRELSRLVAETHAKATTNQRLSLRHLLSAAGSTPTTAAAAIERFIASKKADNEWRELQSRYAALEHSSKEKSLLELLARNTDEKKMVFVHHRETLNRIAALLQRQSTPHVVFEGSMTGPEKDAAIARFRDEIPLLICTESGGEGRNLQFCNTLINFDLPWNPMAIEQRIGRIHRIGQTREVFIFNLVTRDTLEEHVLRILDEKINMFELVVGEIDAILGEMDDEQDFAGLVFNAWVETTETERATAFESLGEKMAEAKAQYEAVKVLDEELFGEEFVAG